MLAVFISGACAMVIELAGARLMAPYLGNTIYTWAAVIGLVMASLSAGYYVGGSLGDRYGDRRHFSTILLCAALFTLAVPFIGWMLLPFTAFLDLWIASVIASFVLVPASVCYGMVSPYAIKLTAKAGEEGKGAGSIFALSTVGSIMGTLGTGFVLIPNMHLTHIFILAAVLMLGASWLAGRKGGFMLMEGVTFIALAGIVSQFGFFPLFDGSVIYAEDTRYYHLTVVEQNVSGQPARVLYLDNAASSGEFGGGEPAFPYLIKTRLGYELVENPARALVVGVAGGTEVEDLKKSFPGVTVDGVDIDPRAVEIGVEFFSLSDDNRTEIIIDDARRYLRKTDRTYDLVLMDVFRGKNIPYNLATRECLSELKGRMGPDGVVVVNLISALDGKNSGAFVHLYNTFSSVFTNVVILPVGTGPMETQNIVLIATDKDVAAFRERHADAIYGGPVPETAPLTDELNPIELFAVK